MTTTDSGAPATRGSAASEGDGYFAPGSVSRRVFADPSSKLGGVAGILLQSLNPMMMRLFEAASGYSSDIEGRGERTGRYVDTTIFGDKAHADAAAEAVRRLHARAVWTDPETGNELRADHEPWLAWTHNALVYGVLRAAQEFGPDLTPAEQDEFVSEQRIAAGLQGVTDPALLPATRAELEAYIDGNKDWMALTLPAARLSRSLRKPSLKGNPAAVFVSVNVQDAILSLLPEWALLLFGIEGRPMNLRAAARTTRRIIASARKRRSTEQLVGEATQRVQTHPYRKVRR
ncbi:oxygenase MpaB family protein [Microbacterium sp. NPDC055910]|uniref:oxygenase MpaB family protein n=1 Tax=Microbacterium sp. NPDC055910 TaxID=3345659 RepID=UPI0035D84E99